jgi:hypothetical protein
MAEFKSNPTVAASFSMVLTEDELRALLHMADFGMPDVMDKVSSEFKPHRGSIRAFFDAVRNDAGLKLQRLDEARGVLSGSLFAVKPHEGEKS